MKREVKIGIFAVTMLICAWGGIRFLSGIDIFSRNAQYYAHYDSVTGLQEASPVEINGVKVGTVTAIELHPEERRVVVELTVKRQFPIPIDSEARLMSGGLMGGRLIELKLGSSPELLASGDQIKASVASDMMEELSQGISPMMERMNRLADELTYTLESVHGVVESNASNIEGLVAHLHSISGNLDAILSSEREGLQGAVHGLSEFSTTLGDNAERLDSLMANMTAFSEQLARADVVAHLDATLQQLNGVLEEIHSGEGSLGQLLNNPDLYNHLAAASDNLSALLADLKANPSRYVHFSLIGRSEKKEAARAARREARELKDSLKAVERAARRK
jgi:phospholipid/cholesterol/gamma-HCH transport system substrate-binding protein